MLLRGAGEGGGTVESEKKYVFFRKIREKNYHQGAGTLWCPFFTSFKCSNLLSHSSFLQVSQI